MSLMGKGVPASLPITRINLLNILQSRRKGASLLFGPAPRKPGKGLPMRAFGLGLHTQRLRQQRLDGSVHAGTTPISLLLNQSSHLIINLMYSNRFQKNPTIAWFIPWLTIHYNRFTSLFTPTPTPRCWRATPPLPPISRRARFRPVLRAGRARREPNTLYAVWPVAHIQSNRSDRHAR